MKRKLLFAAALFACPALFCQIVLKSVDDALAVAAANDRQGQVKLQTALEQSRFAKLSITPFMPELDFAISDSATVDKTSGDYKQKSIEAGVTQKIFCGGKNLLQYKMQREKSLYDFLQVQKELEAQTNSVRSAYYAALLAKMKRDVFLEAVKSAQDVLLFAELEEAQGMLSKSELLESQIKFMEMQAKQKAAQDEFESRSRDLNGLLGIDARKKIEFEQGDFFCEQGARPSLAPRLQELGQKALECSVDLKKARAEARWAKKRLALERRALLPSVAVRAGVSFNGRDFPLTEPSYSFKVILGFDNNPWLPMTLSKSVGAKNGALNSTSGSLSGKAIVNANWFSQTRLSKLGIEEAKLGAQSVERQIQNKVFELVQSIESADQSARLNMETLKLKELRLLLCQIELEQGQIKMTDYLEAVNERAAQKIKCLEAIASRDALEKELEAFASCKI